MCGQASALALCHSCSGTRCQTPPRSNASGPSSRPRSPPRPPIRALREVRDRFLARKGGAIASLMKSVAGAPPADRPLLGKLANQLKNEIESALDAARAALEAGRPVAGGVDVTLPGRLAPLGRLPSRSPTSANQVEAIFSRMGYEILEGPEIEDDYHNFEALNMPPEHPARDMQDTLLSRPRGPAGGPRHTGNPAQHAAAATRSAGHAAPDAHLRHADPLHGGARAPGADRRHRQGVPARQPRSHPHPDVPPVRGAASSTRG